MSSPGHHSDNSRALDSKPQTSPAMMPLAQSPAHDENQPLGTEPYEQHDLVTQNGFSFSSKRGRAASQELLDFDEFLGAIPAEPISAFAALAHDGHNSLSRRSRFSSDFSDLGHAPPECLTMTTADHCLVMAQRLEDMARRNECCDLEIVVFSGHPASRRHVLNMHVAYACASSPVLRTILLERRYDSSKGRRANRSSDFAEQRSPSSNSVSCDTDCYESHSAKTARQGSSSGAKTLVKAESISDSQEQRPQQQPSRASSAPTLACTTSSTSSSSVDGVNNDNDNHSEPERGDASAGQHRAKKRKMGAPGGTQPSAFEDADGRQLSSATEPTASSANRKSTMTGGLGDGSSSHMHSDSPEFATPNVPKRAELLCGARVRTIPGTAPGSLKASVELHGCDIQIETLEIVRTYMYTGILQFTRENVFDVLDCALYLDMQTLVNLCIEYIQVNINDGNLFRVVQIAIRNSLLALEETALDFAGNTFDRLSEQPIWVDAPVEMVRRLLKRDALRTQSEGHVFRALAAWAAADPDARNEDFLDMVCCDMRLGHMSRPDLIELSQHGVCAASKEVRRALYNEALSRQGQAERKVQHAPRVYGPPVGGPAIDCPSYQAAPFDVRRCEQTIMAHERAVCALTVVDHYIVTASGDHKLRVFNSKTWECEQVLEGHENAIVVVKAFDGKLISASPDRTIRIWSTKTWSTIRILNTGKSATCSMALIDGKLITGSDDGCLKSWSVTGWSLLRTFTAHQNVVWALARYSSDVIISGSSDTTIKVWKVSRNDFALITTITVHNDEVQALTVDQKNHWLIAGSDDGRISIHDCKTWTCIRTLGWESRAVLSLINYGSKIIAGLGNGVVSIWDKSTILTSDECLNLEEHKNCVMALAVVDSKLVTAGYDRSIKVWGP